MVRLNIIILSIAIFNLSCSSLDRSKNNKNPKYELIKEDHSSGFKFPKAGNYYEYIFPPKNEYLDSIEIILNELNDKNIKLIEAWYQPGARNCLIPGSLKAAHVLVEPRFILRIKEAKEKYKLDGYKRVDHPNTIQCGYYVTRYIKK